MKLERTITRVWRHPLLLVVCALALVNLGVASLRPAETFWSVDEGGKYIYLHTVLRTGDPGTPLDYPGRYLDQDLRFVPIFHVVIQDGDLYSWWPAGFPLASLPFYRILGWIGLFFLPAISGALCAAVAGLLVRYVFGDSRLLMVGAAVITGLATPVAFYSTTFWEHTPAAALLMTAVLSTLQACRVNRARWMVLAGVTASLATFLRTDIAALAIGLGAAILIVRPRWAILFGTSYLLSCLPWLLFNWSIMGHILSWQWTGSSGVLGSTPFSGLRDAGWLFVPYVLFNAPYIGTFELGTFELGLATSLTLIAAVTPHIKRVRWVSLIASAGLAVTCGRVLLHPQGYRTVSGFLLIAPHIIFASWLYASRPSDRNSTFPIILAGMGLAYLAIYTYRSYLSAGGLQWGPRYMLSLYPLLVVASLGGLAHARSLLKRPVWQALLAVYLVCVMIGLGYEARGVYAAVQTTRYYQQTEEAIGELGPDPIVTDCTWLPMVLPNLYWDGSVFKVRNEANLNRWISEAQRLGIRSAYSLQLDLCEMTPLDEIAVNRSTNPGGITVRQFQISE